MDDIFYEKTLNRIIQGRLRFSRDGLVLFIEEPSNDLIEESYDIYDSTYKEAYFKGVFLKEELKELLFYNGLWSPEDDKNAEKTQEQIEELKLQAFRSFYKPKELRGIKANIRALELEYMKLKSKIHQLDHISCEGVALFAKSVWILSKTINHVNNEPYDYKKFSLNFFLSYYNDNQLTEETYRYIARNYPFRGMWICSKNGINLFNASCAEYTKDQRTLCSYSTMYDNVYESTDCPSEDVINDDDCLDGWFISQRKKYEKDKQKQQAEDLISNPKIKNSQEIFVMTNSEEEAKEIYSLNNDYVRNIIQERQQEIKSSTGNLSHKDLPDVRQERMMNAVNSARSAIKSRGK